MRSATFLCPPPHSSKISQHTADVFLELHQTTCSLLSVITYTLHCVVEHGILLITTYYSASSVWLLTSVSCIFYPWFDIYKAHATKNNVTDCYCGQQQQVERTIINNELSCHRETARCFISLKSLKLNQDHSKWNYPEVHKSLSISLQLCLYLIQFPRHSALNNGVTL